ncbi:MAG: PEP-CTERM sorting domain-containing protein [Lentisphaerae bacterium]|nr:PEP-CTERM sorting domain-containing protein [Lentisphaerota bacterium]
MKKAIVLWLVVLLFAVVSAEAYITVEFDSLSGSYIQYGMLPSASWLDTGIPAGSMFYVAWAGADNTIDSTAAGSHLTSGDDMICTLDAGQTTPAIFYTQPTGAQYGQITVAPSGVNIYAPNGESDFTGKTGVYLRVFDSATPIAGDHYVSGSYNGTNTTFGAPWDTKPGGDAQLTEPPGIANTYEQLDMTQSPDTVGGPGGGSHIVLDSTIQAIPEPGTLGLLALGLAGVFAARKKRT